MQAKAIGIALIILGIVMMAYTGFNYVTTKKVVDLGSIQINQDQGHFIHWLPIVGAILIAAGIIVTVFSKRSRAQSYFPFYWYYGFFRRQRK
jgi:uncharacterized membrane protein